MLTAAPPARRTGRPPLLRVRGLSTPAGGGRGLRDVTLEIAPGELVAVAGEPGAGKTTLIRCLAGDLTPIAGEILLGEDPVAADLAAAGRQGISVVWQDLALCDNLDVAGNLMLGRETPRLMFSPTRFHGTAAATLEKLGIPIRDTTRLVGSLSGGQRQLVAMAKALSREPRLLLLDEPTAALGLAETEQVEELIARLRVRGTAVLLTGRDVKQMLRLADRLIVLHAGQVIGDLDPRETHPDDVAVLLAGQRVDTSARRQLTRLHGLADSLLSADPSSSLSLILSALGPALRADQACIHVVKDGTLQCTDSLGLRPEEIAAWASLPVGDGGGPVGRAAATGERVVAEVRSPGRGELFAGVASSVRAAWSVPVLGPSGVSAVLTVFRGVTGDPERDEVDLLTLYTGYAASAVERDQLLDQVTSRNRVLETIREMLQTLAGPVTVGEGLPQALASLQRGLRADEVALVSQPDTGEMTWRAYAASDAAGDAAPSSALRQAAGRALGEAHRDGRARTLTGDQLTLVLAVPFRAPAGPTALLARWHTGGIDEEETALIEDAAHSLNLALEREEAGLAHQEAAALRRSRELQRGFLSMLSHELRTPLTAIRGYASSLMAPDVTWDAESQQRFLERIAAESARLGRLVDDLLDFSAIESGVLRLQRDWCDIPLVIEAAVSCLPRGAAAEVLVSCEPALPPVWADHDRLEQVLLNLLSNAVRHNPAGTRISVIAAHVADELAAGPGEVRISVSDDGVGFPADVAASPFELGRRRRSRSAGAGIGLSIARGIVDAHGGRIELVPVTRGTEFRIRLPVEVAASGTAAEDAHEPEPIALLGVDGARRDA